MNKRKPQLHSLGVSLTLCAFSVLRCAAQSVPAGQPHLDKILERRPFTAPEAAALDVAGGVGGNADGQVDVRDLVVFLNNQPISATFGSPETLAFYSAASVTLPIFFSKPVTGTLKFDLGGNAEAGSGKDYTLSSASLTVTNATLAQITVNFQPWRGVGGEKVIRLTLNRDPVAIPANGTFSTHLLRIRQFDRGELVGMLSFPPGTGLPSLPVRIGLVSNGSGVCSFQQSGGLLGAELMFSWNTGYQGFPNFSGNIPISIPGQSLGRPTGSSNDVKASLAIQRMAQPYGGELDAYLEGFPADDQPALYQATFTFHNLIAAGARFASGPNPYAVVHHGRLTLQPVRYAAAP